MRFRSALGLTLLLVLLCASAVSAQTTCTANCTVRVGEPFVALFDPPTSGGQHAGFRLFIDNAKVGNDLPASPGTTTINGVTIATRGAHTLQVSAFNADGETKTAALSISAVLPPPGAPTNLRIQVAFTVASDGSISVKLLGIETVPQP
jgi:hypothetical protein